MKTYIFVTYDITGMGGVQMYVSSKAQYLIQNGWNVLVLYSSYYKRKCIIPSLEVFRNGLVQGLNLPPFMISEKEYDNILDRALSVIGNTKGEVIVESHSDTYSPWGEIISSKIKAKHIIVLLNEVFRGRNKLYYDKIDFYDYKYLRGELGGSNAAITKLFEGYKTYNDIQNYNFLIDENPVQDINNSVMKCPSVN